MSDTDKLSELMVTIAYLWGTRNECQEAAACFTVASEMMGIHVEPRAVSVLARDHRTGAQAINGRAAAHEVAPPEYWADNAMYNSSYEFDRAGHMIITSDELSLFFDPTFQQFSHRGLPARPIAGKIRDTHPADSRFDVSFGDGVKVSYFFDDTNAGWQDDFEIAKGNWVQAARRIVDNINARREPEEVGFIVDWEDHPGH